MNKITHSDLNHEFINTLINKDNPIIFEVGAADGNDSLVFLDNYKNIKLYCFEADPRAFTIHAKYINDDRCKLIGKAVSDIDGKVIFHLGNKDVDDPKLYKHQKWHNGKSDRYEVFKEANNIYNKIFNIYSETSTENGWFYSSSMSNSIDWAPVIQKHSIIVDSIKLDSFCEQNNINNIDFLWTDVEASEKKVVNGAVNTLKFTKYLMLEFGLKYIFKEAMDKEETINLMKNYNFSPIKIIENNIIFKNKLL
jgi:FkbM family methyltransferase